MEKNSLFYMANLYPEIGRLFSFFDSGKVEATLNAQKRSLDIVDPHLPSSSYNSSNASFLPSCFEIIILASI